MRLIGLSIAALVFTAAAPAQTPPEDGTQGGPATQREAEPNNRPEAANDFDPTQALEGELGSQDTDYFRLRLEDDGVNRDLTFEIDADISTDICLFSSGGERIKCMRGQFRSLDGVSLNGDYLLSVAPVHVLDAPVTYRLVVGEARPNEKGREVEPNDRWEDATALDASFSAQGRLSKGDLDAYQFTIPGPRQRWRISTSGQSVGHLELRTAGGVELQERSYRDGLELDGLYLPPGDYMVGVRGRHNVEAGDYALTVESMTVAPAVSGGAEFEAEPNDTAGQAQRLNIGTEHTGSLRRGDTDMYRFHLPGQARLRIKAWPAAGGKLSVNLDGQRIAASEAEDSAAEFEGDVLPGDHLLRLRARPAGEGNYRLLIELTDPLTKSEDVLADVDVSISGETPPLAAYSRLGQRVRLGLNVRNTGTEERDLEVLAASSAWAWRLRPDQSSIRVAPGEQRRVAAVLDVLPDARADMPVLLSLGVQAPDGSVASANRRLEAHCAATAVGPRRMWSLPDELLGRVNAAWSGLGASVVDETRYSAAGIDGIVSRSIGAWMSKPGDFTVDLAGDKALTLLGTVIHPAGSTKTGVQLKDFEMQVSDDGVAFRTVLSGTLTADTVEQAFVFDQAVTARYARLRLLSNIAGDGKATGFGEWKVIVAESPDDILGEDVNIADYPLGGNDIYSDPFAGGACCHETFSTADADGQFVHSTEGYEWVTGFRDHRAARIDRLQWVDKPGQGAGGRALQSVSVYVAMESPVGPWTPLADWPLTRETADSATLVLDAPVWARYVKFVAAPLSSGGIPVTPLQVKVFEAPVSHGYRSVIGEWGYGSKEGAFERQLDPVPAAARRDADAGDSIETATILADNARGDVLVGEDEDWYAIDVREGANLLKIRLHTAEPIEYGWEIVDARGVPVTPEIRERPDALEVTAYVAAGRYYLRFFEPQRSIIFSWDTSGSVGPYYDVIDHTMKAFASGVRRGREEVNLIPFNDPSPELMLEEWTGDADTVSAAIVNSDRRFGSSNAESALLLATDEMASREGTRAVLFVTDAETDGLRLTGSLWRRLERVRPRVFSFELSSKGNATPQDMMQSYAAVNRGFYDLALTAGNLQIGFDRAICMLRRPKPYRVRVDLEQVDPPEPGILVVKMDADSESSARAASGDAVEVILDASGSMYQKLGDRFRYEIARDVLDDLVANVLPDGIGFALRAFGNREPSSCRTDLEIELAPLDRDAARGAIRDIEPKPYAYTPIADSIASVANDLAGASGRKTVVLVTDGEESCDGDVDARIEELKSAGIDVQLNVIGFDVDADDVQAARESFRRWAELGGGNYFDAGSASELAESLSRATSMLIPFSVDSAGQNAIASGTVNGDEVSLPPGRYTIRFGDESIAPMEAQIGSGQTTILKVSVAP